MKKLLTILFLALSNPAFAACQHTNTIDLPPFIVNASAMYGYLILSNTTQSPVSITVQFFDDGQDVTSSVTSNNGQLELTGLDSSYMGVQGNTSRSLGGKITWNSEACLDTPLMGVMESQRNYSGNNSRTAVPLNAGQPF